MLIITSQGWPIEPQSPPLQTDIYLQYPSVFENMMKNQVECCKVYEDGICFAVCDKNPMAPLHLVIVPKDRSHGLSRLSNCNQQHVGALGHLIYVAVTLARQFSCLDGYRVVINDGQLGGQTEPHLAVHLLGLRQFQWPPG
jgi:histidine triad (HIT) family protein